MEKRVLSSPHSLSLIPITSLLIFAVYDNRVRLALLQSSFDVNAIPGSLKVSNTIEDGIYKVRITFNHAMADADTLKRFKALTSVRLVAAYTDERGNVRVAGSPDYPLKLEVNENGGVIMGTLSGQSLFTPLFLEEL